MEDLSLYQWLVLGLLSIIAILLWVGVRRAPTVNSLEAMTRRLEDVMRSTSTG